MQSLKRFLRLSEEEQLLIFQAVCAVSLIRVSLVLLSLQAVHRLAVKMAWHCDRPLSADRIVWAVRSAARFVPGSACLAQAFAAHCLLVRHGYAPLLTIGVAKNECGRLEAHSWVVCEDAVLIGGEQIENYTPLLELGSSV
jgi:hypothetical protein